MHHLAIETSFSLQRPDIAPALRQLLATVRDIGRFVLEGAQSEVPDQQPDSAPQRPVRQHPYNLPNIPAQTPINPPNKSYRSPRRNYNDDGTK